VSEIPGEPASEVEQVDVSQFGRELADAVEAALPGWVRRSVLSRLPSPSPSPSPSHSPSRARVDSFRNESLDDAIDEAGRDALTVVVALRSLLATDIDDQRGTPLTVIREAVRYPTEVLRRFDAPVPARDPSDAARFPDDIYALSPASWADIDETVADPGLRWSVAKAFEYKRRHR
jgi:hypothetical protein